MKNELYEILKANELGFIPQEAEEVTLLSLDKSWEIGYTSLEGNKIIRRQIALTSLQALKLFLEGNIPIKRVFGEIEGI